MATEKQLQTSCDAARQMGALDAVVVSPPRQVFTATWVRLRCQYGCSEYGQCLTCPPNSLPGWPERGRFMSNDAANLCKTFLQSVESYLLWDKLKAEPHRAGDFEGVIIGDFRATAEDYELWKQRAHAACVHGSGRHGGRDRDVGELPVLPSPIIRFTQPSAH